MIKVLLWAVVLIAATAASAQPRVVISEIMYHPVELPAFDPDGKPVIDLTKDAHEFVELHNPGATTIPLAGWKLAGGIGYKFAAIDAITPGQFLLVAKNPDRLAAVSAYRLARTNLLGPFSGQLGNHGDTVRLTDETGRTVDSVSYSASFPWAISADALGAEDEFTGLNSALHQYRGRSLERVSYAHPANDPANWLASPLPAGPSPGRSNTVHRDVPLPVVTELAVNSGNPIVRSNQPVRIDCVFSAANGLSGVAVEYFVEDIERTNEPSSTIAMSQANGVGRFTATLPGQPNRAIVRFRIRADRGAGLETVSPRADDPFAWHAYFVTPLRASAKHPHLSGDPRLVGIVRSYHAKLFFVAPCQWEMGAAALGFRFRVLGSCCGLLDLSG